MISWTVTRLPAPTDVFDALSTAWWGVQVSAADAATRVPIDLSATTVKAAVVAPGTKPTAFSAAAWVIDDSVAPALTVATFQVTNGSPGGVPLIPAARWDVWLEASTTTGEGTEVFAAKVDEISIT